MTTLDIATPLLRVILTLGLVTGSVIGIIHFLEEAESAWRRKDWPKLAFNLFLLIFMAIFLERLTSPYTNL